MNSLVLFEVDQDVAILTLNRPERHNSLVPELLRELLEAMAQVGAGPVGAAVLQANGRSFSTGGDVRGFYEHRDDISGYAQEIVGLLNEVILDLIRLPVPVVAAVHGVVSGGSLGLVLGSDVVLVAPEASFTPYYSTVGFSPDGGWTALLPLVIGRRRTEEVLLLDRSIPAEAAVQWGLANLIVHGDEIRNRALATARAIAGMRSGGVRRTKQMLWGEPSSLAGRLEDERRSFVEQIVSTEAHEGMLSFLNRSRR